MSVCVNTEILNKYLDEQEKKEVSLNYLFKLSDDELDEVREMISVLLQRARDYDNYDFEEEMRDTIKELI